MKKLPIDPMDMLKAMGVGHSITEHISLSKKEFDVETDKAIHKIGSIVERIKPQCEYEIIIEFFKGFNFTESQFVQIYLFLKTQSYLSTNPKDFSLAYQKEKVKILENEVKQLKKAAGTPDKKQ